MDGAMSEFRGDDLKEQVEEGEGTGEGQSIAEALVLPLIQKDFPRLLRYSEDPLLRCLEVGSLLSRLVPWSERCTWGQ